jgi:hypothetical protein
MVGAAAKRGRRDDLNANTSRRRKHSMPTDAEKRMMAEIKARLDPPSKEELDQVTARWLFGRNAEKMMRHAPWSFLLTKLMWQKEEEPWA